MPTTTYSRGWGAPVELGSGQELARRTLVAAIRHPSRLWHEAPRLRAFGRSPGTAHRLVHRLAALGVIAIQTTLGRDGGIRFTFGVRRWRTYPVRRGQTARMRPAPDGTAVSQLAAWWDTDPDEPPEEPEPPKPTPGPWHERPEPRLTPNPEGRRPSFREEMERHGFRVPPEWGSKG